MSTPPKSVAPHVVEPLAIAKRLQREGRWAEVEPLRDQMIKEARARGLRRDDAQMWAYGEIERMYPPLPEPDPPEEEEDGSVTNGGIRNTGNGNGDPHAHAREGRLQGLDTIPPGWPDLPDNASLPAEISWVQSQRLRIVEEKPSGAVVVHLDRARSPAPSWAALGWLETSIRSYAKYVDIVARSLATQQDEAEHIRRERMAIDDIKALLAEMRVD